MINIILKFMLFAVLGYVVEVAYVFSGSGKLINRGFLNGPYLPIYAFGSILSVIFLNKYKADVLIVFFMGILITSTLEYFTSYAMEKLFNKRWWDYSHHKYNFNGRITLKNSILFGIGCLVLIYFINPYVDILLAKLNPRLSITLVIIFITIFLTDFVISSISIYKTNKKMLFVLPHIGIKNRILKAYPNLATNNEELLNKIEKLKNELRIKRK